MPNLGNNKKDEHGVAEAKEKLARPLSPHGLPLTERIKIDGWINVPWCVEQAF